MNMLITMKVNLWLSDVMDVRLLSARGRSG